MSAAYCIHSLRAVRRGLPRIPSVTTITPRLLYPRTHAYYSTTHHSDTGRLSLNELYRELDTLSDSDTLTVEVLSSQEEGVGGYNDTTYNISVKDLVQVLDTAADKPITTEARFRFSQDTVQAYVYSSRSSPIAAELMKRGTKDPDRAAKRPIEEAARDADMSAANKDVSKDSSA